jgi:hypothetical protein
VMMRDGCVNVSRGVVMNLVMSMLRAKFCV